MSIGSSDGQFFQDSFEEATQGFGDLSPGSLDPKKAAKPAEKLDELWEDLSKTPDVDANGNATGKLKTNDSGEFQVAGDVVPMQPREQYLNTAGPTNKSADYATGKIQEQNVLPVPIDTLKGWMDRELNRRK